MEIAALVVAALGLLAMVVFATIKGFATIGQIVATEFKKANQDSTANRETIARLTITLDSLTQTLNRVLDTQEDHGDRIAALEREREVVRRVEEALQEERKHPPLPFQHRKADQA